MQKWSLLAMLAVVFFVLLPFSYRYGCLIGQPCPLDPRLPIVISVLLTVLTYLGITLWNKKRKLN
jgi:hypothetical protein